MKLRLRSLESRETLRLEVPNSCTLHRLKETLSQSISLSPSSLHFSLNRKDELQASSLEASLHSLGVTAGDLIYYSRDPTSFVSQTLESEIRSVNVQEGDISRDYETPFQEPVKIGVNLQAPKSKDAVITEDFENPYERLGKQQKPIQNFDKIEVSDVDSREPMSKSCEIEETLVQETSNLQEAPEKQETLELPGAETMYIDEGSVVMPEKLELPGAETMYIDEGSVVMPEKRVPEPYFLRVLAEKLGDGVGPHGLVIVAVHEILLESGFVGFDSVSGMRIDRFDLPDNLLSKVVSMSYTMPELLNDGSNDVSESVALKYQILGHFVNVYGSLAKGGSETHKLCLNAYKLGPIISLVWANSDKNCSLHDKDEYKSLECGDEVFEFWKNVKDVLALPLLIDLCDKAGLSLPACWMHLPTELKLKILECLPGVDVAKMECVSREMRYLASNNELWKQKVVEELRGRSGAEGKTSWKQKFVFFWECHKKRKRPITPLFPRARPYVPIIRDPAPFGNPLIQGGDYDRYPNIHFPPFPFGQRRQVFPRFNGRQNFAPNCNLGES